MKIGKLSAVLVAAAMGALVLPLLSREDASAQGQPQPLYFTAAQAANGSAVYNQYCAACHGQTLAGSGVALPLRGQAFLQKFGGQPATRLLRDIKRMPPGAADQVSPALQADLLAFLAQANGARSGEQAMPTSEQALSALVLPAAGAGRGAREPVSMAPRPGPSRLDNLTPVTPAMLKSPPKEDWLIWRRTYDALGFSPLKQINRGNVKNLQVAWAWSLPAGGNMMTPIVHDGVLYAFSFGDIVEALDAKTGELLWRHQRKLEREGAYHQGKKGVAIAGDVILVPTSDMHVLALNAKTGAVVWDHALDVGSEANFQIKSAPLVTATKVIIGVNGFAEVKGGNFIVALDLATGKEAWRFHTVARPGEPGGDTWNDLPLDRRSGGSVWVSGSYDPDLNLVYFGTAPTYDGRGLRKPVDKPGVTNNALYLNSTLALDADTGRLAWYFQHQANDQLDHDWAYERSLMTLQVDGKPRKVVVTAGKQAIFDALDAATGQYLFSMDLGLQNVFIAIDPKTGAKTTNPAAIPAPDQVLRRFGMPGICPDLLGARNLMSTVYSPQTRWLYVPLSDSCIEPFPNGVQWQKTPDPSAKGKFGLVQALDLQNRKVAWTARDVAPPVGGALGTAGGVLFLGYADRGFRALDDKTGKTLWSTRLDNSPTSYPVTYSVDDQQFVAVATNEGFVHAQAMRQVAGIIPPPAAGATLWVFALPK